MRSRLAEQSELDLIRLNQSLTPAQRLEAFLAHCQLMTALRAAGERMRSEAARRGATAEGTGAVGTGGVRGGAVPTGDSTGPGKSV